jgi:hypothetical protein
MKKNLANYMHGLIWNKKLLISILLWGLSFSFSGTRDAFVSIPGAQILGHGSYQLQAKLGSAHLMSDDDNNTERNFAYISQLAFGFLDRGELRLSYGQDLSLAGTMKFFDEGKLTPGFSFGARQIFGSQEGHFYAVADSLRFLGQNEVFFTLSRTLGEHLRIEGGGSVITTLDSGNVSPFWGIDLLFTHDLHLQYEGFVRNEALHHNLGISWQKEDLFCFSAGLRELHRWFYQEGTISWYSEPANPRYDTWQAPGIYAAISITGWIKQPERAGLESRIITLNRQVNQLKKKQEDTDKRLQIAERIVEDYSPHEADSLREADRRAKELVEKIVQEFYSDAYEPERIQNWQDSLFQLQESAWTFLTTMLRSDFATQRYKETSLRLLGDSRQPRFREVILENLKPDIIIDLQKEALLALKKTGVSPEQWLLLQKNFAEHPNDLLRSAFATIPQPATNTQSESEPSEETSSPR